jgi:hypothetical protein
VKKRFWCYSIHGSVNDDPVRLLFCGDLTILLLGLIIYCLFKLKRKLRHSLRRPSRSDLVQSEFTELKASVDELKVRDTSCPNGKKVEDMQYILEQVQGSLLAEELVQFRL